jgi:primosomal protein N' (replication factor Y)
MENRAIDILVGTQTITKGLHFPHVTLVGILWADLNLHFPFYNAAETTIQQLIQVAGRAGRHHEKSSVIVQAMADHEIFNYLNEVDYLQFYAHEITARQEILYPPCLRMAEIELKHTNELVVEKEGHDVAAFLHSLKTKTIVSILGPAKPPVSKIKKIHSRKIYLKGESFAHMSALFEKIKTKNYKSSIFFTPNPVN